MKLFSRLFAAWLVLACAHYAWSQEALGQKIDQVNIHYIGPATVSEQFIRSHIQLKAGGLYLPGGPATQNDIHSLYQTGQFYNIEIAYEPAADGGAILTYIVQPKPRLTEIRIEGNRKIRLSKIRKKITVKIGQPLDEQKLFSDCQAITDYYEKQGYPGTVVRYVPDIDEAAGTGTATFEITEGRKTKITRIEFIGATAFTQWKLRHQIKTRQHWMFSWLTSSDVYKEDQFEDDKDQLQDFYQSHGYLDFEIKDVRFEYPTPKTMAIKIYVYEGRQYKVGAITFTGTTLLPLAAVQPAYNPGPKPKNVAALGAWYRDKKLNADFRMKTGTTFTPGGLDTNCTAIEDFYGSMGYIDVRRGGGLDVEQIPNVDAGTMDLAFTVQEGQKTYVEKIDIRGNIKTKDKVIRRELAISPGDVFDMVRVRLSQERLENLGYFENVDLRPEPTEPPIAGRQDLIVNVQEKSTGNFTVGAGYDSVESLVGYAEISQGNFDLFNPPYFTGAGQKFRLRVQLGSQDQEYDLNFVEPWFLNRKLALGVDLYRDQWDFDSPNNIFNETRTGAKISLTRALWSDFASGSIYYNPEQVGIDLNGGWFGTQQPNPNPPPPPIPPNVPPSIAAQTGEHFFNRFGAVLSYDTRNNPEGLSNWGQLTELDPEISIGDQTFSKVELKTAWFFPGLFKRHVIEVDGRIGTEKAISGGDVPFYDRFFLGGEYDLRGFKYRNVGPRELNQANQPFAPGSVFSEPVGGDSFYFGSIEYSLPIIEKEGSFGLRFAMFYDVGSVGTGSYTFSGNFNDDWGLGLRLNIPHLGPLRLDYGIPLTHDQYNGSSGQFQFSAGYEREF